MTDAARKIIIDIADNSTARKAERLCEQVYRALKKAGVACSIVNGRGIDIEGEESGWFNEGTVWFKRDRKNHCWKAFQVFNCEDRAL